MYPRYVFLSWNLDDVNTCLETIFTFDKMAYSAIYVPCITRFYARISMALTPRDAKFIIPDLLPFSAPHFSKTCISSYILWILSKFSVTR